MLATSTILFVGGIIAGTALLPFPLVLISSGVVGAMSSALMYQGIDLILRGRRRYWEDSDTWTRLGRL